MSMLQRAASNAYSWWWASHIRTKQSKWLDENLRDMEDKINEMLRIIENDGDSFAQRAEMYYRKRPELVEHVQESYKKYRALAERYDKISKDLQSANKTIATVFPEQVQFSMDDDDDEENDHSTPVFSDDPSRGSKLHSPNIPRVPSAPMKEFRSLSKSISRKAQLNRTSSSAKTVLPPPSSGLTKQEALEEVDKLQKEILALQTEREFMQSVSQRCHKKCDGIDNHIIKIQEQISNLQDEYGIASVIDDDEARTLMAATAIKSCKQTLANLQEQQEQSAKEAQKENKRIEEVQQRFKALRGKFLPGEQVEHQEPIDEAEATKVMNQEDIELLKEKIKKELEADMRSSLTLIQLAEKIDELVEKVANLETAVSSQSALVNRLRSETDGLQGHVKTLEEDKETLMESKETMSIKLRELEEELHNVKCLFQIYQMKNNHLQTDFTEASCNIDHLSVKLQNVKHEEDVEDMEVPRETNGDVVSGVINPVRREESAGSSQKFDGIPQNILAIIQGKKGTKRDLSETESNVESEMGEMAICEGEDQPNWRQLFMSGLEDREKLLLEEYTTVLQNYKDVRKKLGDVENRNRDRFFELAMQIRELKCAVAVRDDEIQSLRKTDFPRKMQVEEYPESMIQAASFLDSNLSSIGSPQQPGYDLMRELHLIESRGRRSELFERGSIKRYPGRDNRSEGRSKHGDSPHQVSAIEEKIRTEIDELLEENLEFWLRFSTSFHQIRKFQTSVHDLKVELSKLRDDKKMEGSGRVQAILSEVRPIYKHLREIHTDLTLWLENNSILNDEQQSRYTSLCCIQDELSKVSAAASRGEEIEISEYQIAKFQGELLNMKQENNKVAGELHTGLDRVRGLKAEVEKILSRMDEEIKLLESKTRSPSFKARIPLRSFLFGVKLKRQKQQKQLASLFACASPALQKQYSNMGEARRSPPPE